MGETPVISADKLHPLSWWFKMVTACMVEEIMKEIFFLLSCFLAKKLLQIGSKGKMKLHK